MVIISRLNNTKGTATCYIKMDNVPEKLFLNKMIKKYKIKKRRVMIMDRAMATVIQI